MKQWYVNSFKVAISTWDTDYRKEIDFIVIEIALSLPFSLFLFLSISLCVCMCVYVFEYVCMFVHVCERERPHRHTLNRYTILIKGLELGTSLIW